MQPAGFSAQGPCSDCMKWGGRKALSITSRISSGTSPELLSMAEFVLLLRALVEREEQEGLVSAGNWTWPLTAHFLPWFYAAQG